MDKRVHRIWIKDDSTELKLGITVESHCDEKDIGGTKQK